MSIADVLDLLRCPLCRRSFTDDATQVRCASGHAFDVARQGHLNLLNAAQPQHADTAAMVQAREQLHALGALDTVVATLSEQIPTAAEVVLDAGSGPGSYLGAALQAGTSKRGLALDISVAAARRAARLPRTGAVVADVWQDWPVVDQSADVILSVFAPRQASEFSRVLRPDGQLITVTPGADHLIELRRTFGLLDVEPGKQDRLRRLLEPTFAPDPVRHVTNTTGWTREQARLAITMGPNAFHTASDGLEDRLDRVRWPLAVTVDCHVQRWRLLP